MQILMKCYHGSRLYGLNNENSDVDYKYVYLPTIEECILNSYTPVIEQSKPEQNRAGDEDHTYYSLQSFMNMAIQCSPTAIEMLHASIDNGALLQTSSLWESIRNKRKQFLTIDVNNLIEFADSQAKKYGSKRLVYNELLELKTLMDNAVAQKRKIRLYEIESSLPVSDIFKFKDVFNAGRDCRFYCVLEKEYETKIHVSEVLKSLDRTISKYGARVKNNNVTTDWKSVSHAARSMSQVIEILKYGDFEYPLKNTKLLMDIKLGKFTPEEVAGIMETLQLEVRELMQDCKLPEKANREYWEDFIVDAYLDNYR